MTTLGFLHPGQMGVTIAANADATKVWAGLGRSPETAERARSADMDDVGTVEALCEASDVVVSVCPPAAAVSVAEEVAGLGFSGTYVDANAIAPTTSLRIAKLFSDYVDGGIIGPPAVKPGTTRLYLAGARADELTAVWSNSALDARAISDTADQAAASALKMAYAGWTKGQGALLLAVNALARSAGIADELWAEWDISQPGLVERSNRMAPGVSRKAWRFSGEMAEIAATMADAGLPTGFHHGAEDLYQRMSEFKDGPEPDLDRVLSAIVGPKSPSS